MTTLILLRHGETYDNINHVLQGHTDGQLSPLGVQQAEEARVALDGMKYDVVLCSDLKRCVDTASIVCEGRNVDVVYTKLLRERDWGSVTGMTVDANHKIVIPDDAESVPAMKARARVLLDYVSSTYKGRVVLAVSHGLFCRCIQAVYQGQEIADIVPMKNVETRVIELA